MTQLDFVTQHPHMQESDDGRYRIRKYITEDHVLQYRAFCINEFGHEVMIGAYDCRAAASAKCCFHAGIAPIEMDQPQESQR